MGKPDLFAKRTMAEQAEPLTQGGASWREAPEIGLERVQGDGILVIRDPLRLRCLPAPWNLATVVEEIVVEFKMAGDHVDVANVTRILLRRLARELQRMEERIRGQTRWVGRQTIWLASAYVPAWAIERYQPLQVAPGCYEWAHEHFTALWIAANELPLRDELIPFLIARTGRRWEEFVSWVLPRKKPLRWLEMLLESGAMAHRLSEEEDKRATLEQIRQADAIGRRNLKHNLLFLLEAFPDVRKKLTTKAVREGHKRGLEKGVEKGIEKGIVQRTEDGHREAILTVLHARNFDVRPAHLAKLNACSDKDTLQRWLVRAVHAASVDEALS